MNANTSKKTNLFIVLEGINGAGKSTAINEIVKFLESKSKKVFITKEPGSPHLKLGEAIANIVKGGSAGKITPEAEALLFAADRVEHVKTVIIPALERKEFVVCDRFVYSSIVFQGFARGLGRELIERVNKVSTDLVKPDLVLLFDLPVETALTRLHKRSSTAVSGDKDIFEEENIKFHERLRAGYLELAKENPDIFVVIDAAKDQAEVIEDVIEVMEHRTHHF